MLRLGNWEVVNDATGASIEAEHIEKWLWGLDNCDRSRKKNGAHDCFKEEYNHAAVEKDMELDSLEFIRQFALHTLPKGFVRIRKFGILSSTSKESAALIFKEQLFDRIPQGVAKART